MWVIKCLAVWLSGNIVGNIVGNINKVTLCQAGLVLRWVTVHGYTVIVFNQDSIPRPTQPGHPSVGRLNKY